LEEGATVITSNKEGFSQKKIIEVRPRKLKEYETLTDINEIDLSALIPGGFKAAESTKFISLKDIQSIKFPEEMAQWTDSSVALAEPLVISGPVVKGFGRGST